ncbi:hypothetical protein [Streptomyces sp. H27-D2]|uniref:hypothetical protein n=1 Tax=Streptomyces sp. H27-D2 TaxID=3046304 RepID=UPI002DBDDDA0|nr:hypothetical protein [Streptomyces sp. H27-D2]MEC4014771.1 hypothetical protein [Streptomyces sp. H27-D2]
MSYFMNDIRGESVNAPNEAQIREILSALQGADGEHADVSLVHESGWSLSVYPEKVLIWENVEYPSAPPREFSLESWQEIFDVLLRVAQGDISAVTRVASTG